MTRTVSSIVVVLSSALLGCGGMDSGATAQLIGNSPPRIEAVEVAVDSSGLALLSATASDAEGGTLLYNWGSRSLSPPVVSESQIVLDSAQVDPGTVTAHLVVQDALGRLATAQVVFARDAGCALCGSYAVTLMPTPIDEPCVVVHERCITSCSPDERLAAVDAGCASECAVGLALCRTNPS